MFLRFLKGWGNNGQLDLIRPVNRMGVAGRIGCPQPRIAGGCGMARPTRLVLARLGGGLVAGHIAEPVLQTRRPQPAVGYRICGD